MSRDYYKIKKLFNCEQDNKAETSTNSCPTNKLYYERKGKLDAIFTGQAIFSTLYTGKSSGKHDRYDLWVILWLVT